MKPTLIALLSLGFVLGCGKNEKPVELPAITVPDKKTKKYSEDIIESKIRAQLNKTKGRLAQKDYLKVKQLNIQGQGVVDISLLAKLPNLEYLSAGGNPISDISPLKQLVKLKDLDLSNTQVTNLTNIMQMDHLIYLDLTETLYLKESEIEAIKKAMPNCTILHGTK